jgi:hypothetical protein
VRPTLVVPIRLCATLTGHLRSVPCICDRCRSTRIPGTARKLTVEEKPIAKPRVLHQLANLTLLGVWRSEFDTKEKKEQPYDVLLVRNEVRGCVLVIEHDGDVLRSVLVDIWEVVNKEAPVLDGTVYTPINSVWMAMTSSCARKGLESSTPCAADMSPSCVVSGPTGDGAAVATPMSNARRYGRRARAFARGRRGSCVVLRSNSLPRRRKPAETEGTAWLSEATSLSDVLPKNVCEMIGGWAGADEGRASNIDDDRSSGVRCLFCGAIERRSRPGRGAWVEAAKRPCGLSI